MRFVNNLGVWSWQRSMTHIKSNIAWYSLEKYHEE
jgi:hypothetical protein